MDHPGEWVVVTCVDSSPLNNVEEQPLRTPRDFRALAPITRTFSITPISRKSWITFPLAANDCATVNELRFCSDVRALKAKGSRARRAVIFTGLSRSFSSFGGKLFTHLINWLTNRESIRGVSR